jgi:UPF0755 protein
MLERKRSRGTGKYVRLSILVVFLGLMIMVVVVFQKYQNVYTSNVEMDSDYKIFYISSGSTYDEVKDDLEQLNILIDKKSFHWVAEKKEYPLSVKAGRYKILNGMTNNELVNMLRAGEQYPVMLVFNNIRTLAQLAGKVSVYIEPDSLELLSHLIDSQLPEKYGFTQQSFIGMFIPDTYEFFWSSSSVEFTNRMAREYENFWKKRDKKLGKIEMTREEVSALASIVDEETTHDDENERVAGLYINRLEQGMPLQADPTLKFALGDFTIKRILNEDKEINSPYNTYKIRGLPPGPITIPSVSAIDGVLNYENHNFIFMCAKSDFSGYHAFARSLKQHNRNATEYQRALNKKGIYR